MKWEGLDWDHFRGSHVGLNLAIGELEGLDEVLEKYVRYGPGREVCLQAGGSLGVFAAYLALDFRDVYTFEPDPESFAALCHNCPEPNVHKFQAALGVDRGRLVRTVRARRDGKPETHEGTRYVTHEGEGNVISLRIDDLGLRRLDFLCLDVEGSENDVLWGAEETLRRLKPVLMLEVNKQTDLAGVGQETLLSTVAAFGYRQVHAFASNRVFVRGGK